MDPKATPQQNWFADRRWGVFCHYLAAVQNASGNYHNTKGYRTDWDECVNDLDVELLARQLAQVNAGYLVFTVMQGGRYLCAPNETYRRYTGFAPGEGDCTRDLIGDLIAALDQYNIPLFLYFTGDGPHLDPKAMLGLYGAEVDIAAGKAPVTDDFIAKWADVMREYSLRYGKKIAGWWLDGAYPPLGYTHERLRPFYDAAKAGNPDTLFSANWFGCFKSGREVQVPGLNRPVIMGDFYHEIAPPTPVCDYTAGEVVSLDVYPEAQLVNGAQAHILSFLGIPNHPIEVYDGWGARGCKYSIEYLMKYVKQVNACGGVVSLDVCLYRDGRIDPDQLRVLKMLAGLRRAPGV